MGLFFGQRLGPYEIEAPLGTGGMGEVYRARDTRLDRLVALKVLRAREASDPHFQRRLTREAKSISQLNHPHIWFEELKARVAPPGETAARVATCPMNS